MWSVSTPPYGMSRLEAAQRTKHGIQAECAEGLSESPDLRLNNFLVDLIRHAPGPPPVARTTDDLPFAPWARPCTRPALDQGKQSTHLRLAPTAKYASEEDTRKYPLGAWRSSTGGVVVLDDQDVAAVL